MSGEIDPHNDEIWHITQERDSARATVSMWLEANADGGWIDKLRADNTQLRKKVDRLSQRNGVLETAQTACLGERDTAIADSARFGESNQILIVENTALACNNDQLKSQLTKARADAAVMRGALEYCGCHEHSESPCDESGSHYKSVCEFCKRVDSALSTDSGLDLLARYREAVELLRETQEIVNLTKPTEWFTLRDTLLATVKGES